jgi:2,3-bisphosphoglycerate-independent phosphoglycerate mutase
MTKKTALIILDGWGIGNGSSSDGIALSKTPVMHQLLKDWPHATLKTWGEDVGLPQGQMGNSEVGHLNIGAGRVVYQDLVRINLAIRHRSFFEEPVLQETAAYVKKEQKSLHLFGLVSDGGVHSSLEHLLALLEWAELNQLPRVNIHVFTDGRDTDPKSGLAFVKQLEKGIKDLGSNAKIVSLVGRYYAMDRDKRWERVSRAYQLLVKGEGKFFESATAALEHSYAAGTTDEFVEPFVIGNPEAGHWVKDGDAVISFNFRTDRCREITQVLTQQDMPEFGMKKLNLHYVTMTRYDENFKGVHVIYEKDNLQETLGEMVSKAGLRQLRIAETEKYPHVTFFFSGGREENFLGEERIMIASPKVATYDLQPEMSAPGIKDAVVKAIKEQQPDFICLNFANPDMVGHTGVIEAVIKAIETVDRMLGEVVEAALEKDYRLVIIADHGNADYMKNEDGSPNTAHSLNPVPIIVVGAELHKVDDGRLADVAPTILKLMGLQQPASMNGRALI